MRFRKILLVTCLATGTIIPGLYILRGFITSAVFNAYHIMVGVLFSVTLTVVISFINFGIYNFLKKKFGNDRIQKKRIVLEFVLTTIVAIVASCLVFLLFRYLFDFYNSIQNTSLSLLTNMIISVVVNFIVFTIIEAFVWFHAWKKLAIESEQLKREKAESNYAALKSQVNPHFLFNSLNSLSSLIRVSPEKAVDFVDNFSKIYRYVLEVSDKLVVELNDELIFLQSYYFLQKIRFGNNLNIDIKVDAQKLNCFILPLSLQFLIENAIKHNEVSSEYPLFISVEADDEFLIVINNLQKKLTAESSTGIGISSICQRYSHITDTKPIFYIENNRYIAKIPLIIES
jgi:two-component system LytT family sensor kinase